MLCGNEVVENSEFIFGTVKYLKPPSTDMSAQIRVWIIIFALLLKLGSGWNQGTVLPKGWTIEGQNYILRPKRAPVAVVHFIGGAGALYQRCILPIFRSAGLVFPPIHLNDSLMVYQLLPHRAPAAVGSVPLVYRKFLESLPPNLLVVCTPYQLSIDYLEACDSIIESFSNVAGDLSEEFGALPVYGVGHSLGAVLQCLISSLFPATPRAGNVLVGFGTRTIADSVGNEDLYNNLVLPVTEILSPGTPAIEALLKISYELSVGKVRAGLVWWGMGSEGGVGGWGARRLEYDGGLGVRQVSSLTSFVPPFFPHSFRTP